MHRSVTFSEIFSSTFSDDLSKYDDSYGNNGKAKFVAKIGIGLVEFMLSSIFLCYGIIFSECIKVQYYTAETGLWTTILYISAWNIAGPWSRCICEYFQNSKYVVFRYITGAATLLLFIGVIIPDQFFSYGIFGGVFSNLIYTQLKMIAVEKFHIDKKVFEGNVQVARALNLLIMPHFMLLLVSYYTTYQVKLIFAAFLLNVFPAMLIIRPQEDEQKYAEISRYQTLPGFSNQIREMMDFTNSVHLSDTNKSETSSSEEEEEEERDVVLGEQGSSSDFNSSEEQLLQPTYLTPLTVQTYYKNAGVNILPEIPEETENEIDDNAADAISSMEISKISTKLEEINQKSRVIVKELERGENAYENAAQESNSKERKDSIKEILNINDLISSKLPDAPERIQNIEYIPNYSNNTGFLRDLRTIKTSVFCGCSPYRKFIWKRRFRNITDFLLDNILKPLFASLKDIHFYPIVLSKATTNIISNMYITVAPYIASEKNNSQPEDATFLLSYIAFSWCLFLVLLPLVINFSHGKMRVTFICGLLLIGTSMTLISRKMTNDVITISCLLFGFGYGATHYAENMVYRSFIGARKWNTVKGTLETTSALLVILTYYIIYHFKFHLRELLLAAFATYYLNALLWIVAPILKQVILILNQRCRRRNRQDSFL